MESNDVLKSSQGYKKIGANTVIIREGVSDGGHMYIILSGDAEVYKDFGGSGQIPVIAMTANVFKEDIEKCLAAGMNDHLGKPLDIDNVMEKLRKYLPESAGNRERAT